MAYPAKAIANYFLEKAWAENRNIDPMKIQKLVYVAHGWYLGNTNDPLVREDVYAWDYGPVIEPLYHEFKKYGSGPIRRKATSFAGAFAIPTDAIDVAAFLDLIWENYKDYTGPQLSVLTHAKDTPWHKTYHDKGRSTVISNDVIRQHYSELVDATD